MNDFMKQLLLDVFPTPSPSFDSFIAVGNEEAVHVLQHLSPGQSIYLYGPSGCGKSHLTEAIAYQSEQALFLSPYSPLSAFEQALYSDTKLIIVDDVHLLNDMQQAQLFILFNYWREKAASDYAFALIISGECAPQQLPIREDLRTRLSWGFIFRLHLLSDDDKIIALQQFAKERALDISIDTINWLLTHYDRRLTKLISIIEMLDTYSLETKRPITLPLLRDLIARQAEQ